MPDYAGTESTLVPGRLRGYRLWGLQDKEPLLHSTNTTHCWQRGDNEAMCCYYNHPDAPAPISMCHCGFYAKHDHTYFDDIAGWIEDTTYVAGVIEAWGKILLGDKGFRAQYARIVAITPYTNLSLKNRHRIKNIASSYGVEYQERIEYLAERYPKSDISDLLPNTEPKKSVWMDDNGITRRDFSSYTTVDWSSIEETIMTQTTYDGVTVPTFDYLGYMRNLITRNLSNPD